MAETIDPMFAKFRQRALAWQDPMSGMPFASMYLPISGLNMS